MFSSEFILQNKPKTAPVIPVWTRDNICDLYLHLSGLTITTKQYGSKPWFELAYQCLTDPSDRANVRVQKKLATDTHQILEFFTHEGKFYDEPNVWLNQCVSSSAEQNPDWFYNLCLELIMDNIIPVVVFDGDNGDNPNDGYPNALRQLPIVISTLKDLKDKVLFARFWDGIWWRDGNGQIQGSNRYNIENFGTEFRKIHPTGCLALEFGIGLCQLGDDVITYGPNGLLRDYDVFCNEFGSNVHEPNTWQIVGRMNRPYTAPPDMYNDNPHPPYYLAPGTTRGKYYWKALENKAYEWVRNQVTLSQLSEDEEYFRNMGVSNPCW